jgi:hypothetical protein
VGANAGQPAEFRFDAEGRFVDGTEPPPELLEAPL